MNKDFGDSLDSYRDGLVSLIALAHQSVPPEELIFAGVSLLSIYCYDNAPSDEVARKTLEASLQYGLTLHGGEE